MQSLVIFSTPFNIFTSLDLCSQCNESSLSDEGLRSGLMMPSLMSSRLLTVDIVDLIDDDFNNDNNDVTDNDDDDGDSNNCNVATGGWESYHYRPDKLRLTPDKYLVTGKIF